MSKKKIIILILVLLIITSGWICISFLTSNEVITRLSLCSSLIFGTGSIIASAAALAISISSNKKAESIRLQRIEDDANKFISENSDELCYIPLCLVANAYDSHHKYIRKIYNSFNLLNKELQKEVLKQLNYEYSLIGNNSWISKEIEEIREFIKNNDLGTDFLYDSGKYFHRAMDYPENSYDSKCEFAHFMPDYFHWNPKIFFKEDKAYQENVTFDTYLNSYIIERNKNSPLFALHRKDKPLDILAAICNLHNCPEEDICYWEMEVVFCISLLIQKDLKSDEFVFISRGDAQIETYEDRYLEVLIELYNQYILRKQLKSVN